MAQENEKLLERFDEAMLELFDRSLRLEPPYKPLILRNMVAKLRGKAAADQLLATNEPSSGFGDLLMRGKEALKLSVEYLVLQNPWRTLFTPQQLEKARSRLRRVGCDLPPEELEPVIENQIPSATTPREARLLEGQVHQVILDTHERNATARARCIEHYGSSCVACDFNFGDVYGELADGYIHVHHIQPVSEMKAEYSVDPVADLRPVCPNCHSVIHLGGGSRSIEEVKLLLGQRRKAPSE